MYTEETSSTFTYYLNPTAYPSASIRYTSLEFNWETEHYNSVLEITVSFLGIHKWEPDICIGFSFAVYLQMLINE